MAQDGINGAIAVGCLDQYLALDKCRANDPVCTHPNPNACVPENTAYIQDRKSVAEGKSADLGGRRIIKKQRQLRSVARWSACSAARAAARRTIRAGYADS